jgi:hypothetical protein
MAMLFGFNWSARFLRAGVANAWLPMIAQNKINRSTIHQAQLASTTTLARVKIRVARKSFIAFSGEIK